MQGETVELTTGTERGAAQVTWDEAGRTATVHLAGMLQNDQPASVSLRGLRTDAGGQAHGGSTLGDDSLDFLVGNRPTVVTSIPGNGEIGVYPAPASTVIDLSLTFSEAMDTALGQLMLVAEDGVSSAVAVEWTDGGKRAVGRVHGNPALGGRVLADDTRYEVRLDGFADAAGNPIAHPAHVAFTTGTLDALLNHSCGHVTFGPFASVAATAGALDAPYADTGHVSYTVQLPRQGDGYHGYTRFRVATGTRYDLFLDRPVAVIGVAGEREHPLATAATPPACDGITHRAWFTADADGEWLLSHAAGSPSFNMIVEATAAR